MASALSSAVVGTLAGRTWHPGDAGFDQASTPWNLAIRQPVVAVVDAADAADVAAVVRHARSAGLAVAPQSTGHGASGTAAGTVLLRTRRLDDVTVDAAARTARVGAGASWGAVQAAAAPHGLTTLLGSSPGVGAVGYTLGGGVGWFGRAHGLAADRVRAFDVVDADGEPRRVSATDDPDLFWALRGGGGDLAVVTAMEIDLVPAPALTGGSIVWPAERAAAVLDAFRTVTATAPRELSLWLTRAEAPGAPAVVVVQAAYLGEAGAALELLAPLTEVEGSLARTVGPLDLADVGTITNDRVEPAAGRSRAELLRTVDDATVDRLFTSPVAPLLLLQLRHLGGALAEPGPGAGALGAIAEPFLLYAFGLAFDPAVSGAVAERLGALPEDLGDLATGRKPTSFLSTADTAAAAFDATTLERLRDLKRARDPHGVVRGAYPLLG